MADDGTRIEWCDATWQPINEPRLDQPLRWARPRRIFVCAHGDLFAENVPDAWIDRIFAVMALAPQHTFLVLTKRAVRIREYITDYNYRAPSLPDAVIEQVLTIGADWPEADTTFALRKPPWPLPNVWLGVSAEDRRRWEERVSELRRTPAAIRFVSAAFGSNRSRPRSR